MAKRSNLVNERKEMHLTQDQLSTKLDIATVTLRKIENGSGLSNELAVKMANFFKKPLEYLFPDIFLLDFDTKGSKRNNPA
ncbi:helix-turn-helix transcriptional regulator [Lentilactobacillus sp. SPB1-3]|uniref:Helix-turn-helix transcriptional regulator n=1 Tax=Lentilactobacillus terminaliae TaxID=3003483 RepID=A0ACD5DD11_9LACO|nr:helix-turn-helix transcriptional regulator [Lentilactobacillus sp. SPB1-3]MCZ0978151.1 helix-turn-helix transcriptional regulator [Lentilactobacillus sp. SPB1-3]